MKPHHMRTSEKIENRKLVQLSLSNRAPYWYNPRLDHGNSKAVGPMRSDAHHGIKARMKGSC